MNLLEQVMGTDIIVNNYINNQLELLNKLFLVLEENLHYKSFSNVDKKELENYAKSYISVCGNIVNKGSFFIGYTKQDLSTSIKTRTNLFLKGMYKLSDVVPLLDEMHIDYTEDAVMTGYFSVCFNPSKAKVRQIIIDQFLKENSQDDTRPKTPTQP